MKKPIILIVLALLVTGLVLFFTNFTNNKNKEAESLLTQSTEEPSTIIKNGNTSSSQSEKEIKWVTYRNADFNFSFSYPKNCEIKEDIEYPNAETSTIFRIDCEDEMLDTLVRTAFIYTGLYDSYLEEQKNKQETTGIRNYSLPSGENILELKTKRDSVREEFLLTYISKDNSNVSLEIYGPPTNSPQYLIDSYNKIVSSFRFE